MAKWTRESALVYLANNPAFTPVKPLDQYTTPYLKRTASAFEKAEQAGKRAPTTTERRGHARAPVTFLKKEGHQLDQARITKPADRDLDQADLLNLWRKTKKKGDDVLVVLRGIVDYLPVRGTVPDNRIQTLSFWSDRESLKDFIESMADISDFCEMVSGLKWEEVLSVSFAYPD